MGHRLVASALVALAAAALASCSVGGLSDASNCREYLRAKVSAQREYARQTRRELRGRDALFDREVTVDAVRRAVKEECRATRRAGLSLGDLGYPLLAYYLNEKVSRKKKTLAVASRLRAAAASGSRLPQCARLERQDATTLSIGDPRTRVPCVDGDGPARSAFLDPDAVEETTLDSGDELGRVVRSLLGKKPQPLMP